MINSFFYFFFNSMKYYESFNEVKRRCICFIGLSKKKIFLVLIAVMLVMTIMSVSATDIKDDQNLTDNNDDIVLSSGSSDEIIADGEESFSNLQSDINSASDSITLNRDYKFTTGDDINGVKINKKITINGNGHTIDASNSARVFNITGNNVIFDYEVSE